MSLAVFDGDLNAHDATEPADLRMHELRHTTVTLLIDAGAHPKAIQPQLGHSSIAVTLDTYGHLFPSYLGELAERLEESRDAVLQQAAASPRPIEVKAPRLAQVERGRTQ